MARYCAQDAVQGSDSQRSMSGDSNPMRTRYLRLKNDMAADLMDWGVSPMAAKGGGEVVAAEVARNFHPKVSISSRTK